MNERIFEAAAAAGFLFATMAHAAPNATLQAFLDEAYSQAQAGLGGVDLSQHSVKVRAYVDADGRLTSVRAVDAAGSRDAAFKVETAVKHVRVHYVPPALIGAQVNLAFGSADTQLAKAR